MKIIRPMFVVITLAQICFCQEIREKNYLLHVEVRDIDGKLVSGVKVITGRLVPGPGGKIPPAKSVTIESEAADSGGKIGLAYKSLPEPDGNASVYGDGYYTSSYSFRWKSSGDGDVSTRIADIAAILKPLRNPVKMIVHPNCGLRIRNLNETYAFDLEQGEAVAPNGIGTNRDIMVILDGTRKENGPGQQDDIDFTARISFSNPLDGFFEFEGMPKDGAHGSALISDYLAPADGYKSEITRRGQQGKFREGAGYWEYKHSLENKSYYFRVRTVTDSSGRIVSCHYGKIYGPVILNPANSREKDPASKTQAILGIYEVYFNPTPNDRNVECDTSVNLLKKTDEYGKPIRIKRP